MKWHVLGNATTVDVGKSSKKKEKKEKRKGADTSVKALKKLIGWKLESGGIRQGEIRKIQALAAEMTAPLDSLPSWIILFPVKQ